MRTIVTVVAGMFRCIGVVVIVMERTLPAPATTAQRWYQLFALPVESQPALAFRFAKGIVAKRFTISSDAASRTIVLSARTA